MKCVMMALLVFFYSSFSYANLLCQGSWWEDGSRADDLSAVVQPSYVNEICDSDSGNRPLHLALSISSLFSVNNYLAMAMAIDSGADLYAENEQEQTPLSLAEERYQAVFRAWDEAVTNAFCHGEPDALFEHQRQMALETATYAMIISFADQISLDEAHDGIEASLLEKSLQRRYECRAR